MNDIEFGVVASGPVRPSNTSVTILEQAINNPSVSNCNLYVLPFRIRKIGTTASGLATAGGIYFESLDSGDTRVTNSILYFESDGSTDTYTAKIYSFVTNQGDNVTVAGLDVGKLYYFIKILENNAGANYGLDSLISTTPDLTGVVNSVQKNYDATAPTKIRLMVREANTCFSIVDVFTPEMLENISVIGTKNVTHSLEGIVTTMTEMPFTVDPPTINFFDYHAEDFTGLLVNKTTDIDLNVDLALVDVSVVDSKVDDVDTAVEDVNTELVDADYGLSAIETKVLTVTSDVSDVAIDTAYSVEKEALLLDADADIDEKTDHLVRLASVPQLTQDEINPGPPLDIPVGTTPGTVEYTAVAWEKYNYGNAVPSEEAGCPGT